MIKGILFYIILCIAVGWYASTINRNFIIWAIISAIATPFLTSMILLIMGSIEEKKTT